jgi:parallel beta-helix repeat protein
MTRRRPVRPCRLRLESLEDRTTPATFTVNTTLDEVTPGDGKLSLREAITKANALANADTIVVPAGVYKIALTGAGENANATGDFDIHDAVTIQGAGAGLTIIDGQQEDRVLHVLGSAPSSIKVVLQGLTIRNGSAVSGGGIEVGNANLVVRDCAVTGNRASDNGGGIANFDEPGTGDITLVRTTVNRNVSRLGGGGLIVGGNSVLTVKDSAVRHNIGTSGGGIDAGTVTLSNSNVSGNEGSGLGGGGIKASTATLTNCTVSGNVVSGIGSGGGGINAITATLTNCTISGNSTLGSSGNGGGISAATATLTGCTVSGNTAAAGGGGLIATTVTLTRCTVSGNTANGNGGGIAAATATLTNSTVSGNSSITGGGGGINAVTTATLTNCTVSGNLAKSGGGGIDSADVTLTNTTISSNTAPPGAGGGLRVTGAGTNTILNCTIAENTAHTGGGVFVSGGTLNIKNTIVALNLIDSTGSGPDLSGAFTSQGHNLIGDGTSSTGFTNGGNGDLVGDNINPIDPKLGPLQNNGGPTKTMALLAGSRAIDAGDNAGVVLVAFDQRGAGFPRKKDGNGDGIAVVDIGAFEK